MSLEEFSITVFCWVDESIESVTGGVKVRPGGVAPRLHDSEVIPLEIVGEVLGHEGDEAIWSYFKRPWAAWFPRLGDRSTFVRQAANLWRVKQLLHERLVAALGARAADGHLIDGVPIAFGKLARGPQPRPESRGRRRLLRRQARVLLRLESPPADRSTRGGGGHHPYSRQRR